MPLSRSGDPEPGGTAGALGGSAPAVSPVEYRGDPVSASDEGLTKVARVIQGLDPDGSRTAGVLRSTLDQLYDGQRTGRYRWDELHKTEKTHCGTLVEINMQREFGFDDGGSLDYSIAGFEVDCKYSQTHGGWMIPPEAEHHLCLLITANDERATWSMGLLRMEPTALTSGKNRDIKRTVSAAGRASIFWLFDSAPLPPNILLQLPRPEVDAILSLSHGTKRLDELFRRTLGRRVGRGVVATVARQHDYMRRIRANGGSRTTLRAEGIVILGQYDAHRAIARQLGTEVPSSGESVAVRLAPASTPGRGVAVIDGGLWRVAGASDPVVAAPALPLPRRHESEYD